MFFFFSATDEIDPVDYLPSYRIEQLKALSQSPDIYDKLTRALGKSRCSKTLYVCL